MYFDFSRNRAHPAPRECSTFTHCMLFYRPANTVMRANQAAMLGNSDSGRWTSFAYISDDASVRSARVSAVPTTYGLLFSRLFRTAANLERDCRDRVEFPEHELAVDERRDEAVGFARLEPRRARGALDDVHRDALQLETQLYATADLQTVRRARPARR